MALFQKSVINKYLKNLDNEKVSKAYENFQQFYGNKLRLHNIMQLKEENYQEGFLREIFVETLGYTINPDTDFNLTTEFKNLNDTRKADGAILREGKAIGVIELKSTKTKHLENIKEQAFSYKNNQPGCRYVITSNFQSLRFYIDDATEFEEFNLFNLNEKDFKLLYLLLSKESIFSDLPHKLKEETKLHENDISAQLYEDYKRFKNKIFENLVKNNPQYDKLLLFKKSQKLLDRFLFIFFAEDSGLIPPNAISKIVEQWKTLQELDEYKTLYSRFQKLFSHLDKGHVYKKWGEIPAYNGGLFRDDELLDSNELKIDDEVLEKDSLSLSAYDFNTEVDVNILGHIFEHSLNEIEEITAELSATRGRVPLTKKKSKRKKDGIFYTPKYITKYIVENTLGTLCKEKKEELKIKNILIDESFRRKATTRGHAPLSLSTKGKKLYKTLNTYKNWLLTLKILDPACGSGAFLNQTLDFLIAEHKQTDDLIAALTGENLRLFDTDKSILENNIYGVDINEESVEIAKLSLWLRTAQKGRPLSDLSGNIKCGNSLIDDPEIAGDKAFDWNVEFPQIFKKKEKEAWHITLATHDSRTSQRMIDHKVRLKRDGGMRPKAEPIWLNTEDEIIVTKYIAEVVKEDNLNVTAYNICGDHVHLLLICEKEEMPKIVGKIKAVSARKYNIEKGITVPDTTSESVTTRRHVPLSEKETNSKTEKKKYNSLWVQKFGKKKITDKEQYRNTLNYIANNRIKHKLPENKDLQNMAKEISCTTKHAFRTEYTGGFDVVIGNPPYVQANEFQEYYANDYKTAQCGDLYAYFIEKGVQILHKNGLFSYITPSLYIKGIKYETLRSYLLETIDIIEILDKGDGVFSDVQMPTAILTIRNSNEKQQNWDEFIPGSGIVSKIKNNTVSINEFSKIKRGLEIGKDKVFNDGNGVKILTGENISRYFIKTTSLITDETYTEFKKDNYYFTGKRVVIRETGNRLTSIYINQDVQQNRSLYSIKIEDNNISNHYVLSILNSALIQYFYKSKFAANTNVFPKIRIAQVKEIPIKTISLEKQKPFIKKADQMLSLNKELQTKAEKFIKRIKSNLEIEKITNKLQNFYNFDFKTFISELKKQKIKLTFTQQDEWEDYFDSYKQEINNLQNQINQTDKEIDKMVYKLYELTEEEIEIVEKSVK